MYSDDLYNSGNLLLGAKGGDGLKSDNYISHYKISNGDGVNYVNISSSRFVGSNSIKEHDNTKEGVIRIYLLSKN